jgi:2-aminoethylphosphonate--pyruvate transaminase/phosphonoacetaldehyde hydrolase
MTIRGIVLDLAGTAVDYGSLTPVEAFKKTFADFAIPVSTQLIRKYTGMEKIAQTKAILADPQESKLWHQVYPQLTENEMFKKIYDSLEVNIIQILKKNSELLPGMQVLIKYTNENQIMLATTTGYSDRMIQSVAGNFKQQGFDPLYNITGDQTNHVTRPQPDMLQLAMKKMKIEDPTQVIKVGDTVNDIREAQNAGTISVATVEGGNLIGLSKDDFYHLSLDQQAQKIAEAKQILAAAKPDYIIDNLFALKPIIENLNHHTILLTPGPATLSPTVKKVMLNDLGTWDDDYKIITQKIRQQLLKIAGVTNQDYSAILLQGSGTYGVEAVLATLEADSTILIASNGVYGRRMSQIADRLGIKHLDLKFKDTEVVDQKKVLDVLAQHPEITHFAMVHCETTTGIINQIELLIPKLHEQGIITIVDAMSSFGGVPIDLRKLQSDFLISSSNKCIQGAPGFVFVIARKSVLENLQGHAHSLALDLYEQYKCFEENHGKWRFTSPTHIVAAFWQALLELADEGGVAARNKRYIQLEKYIRAGFIKLGFDTIIDERNQSPIITSFLYPDRNFKFDQFYQFLKRHGFIIYPGKLTEVDCFRIGNIGNLKLIDAQRLLKYTAQYLQ